ncbi:hypothetical protein [Desulfomarina sp.]
MTRSVRGCVPTLERGNNADAGAWEQCQAEAWGTMLEQQVVG